MTYTVISTQSFAVLGDFEDEMTAQEAVYESLSSGEAGPGDIMVMVYDDDGKVVQD